MYSLETKCDFIGPVITSIRMGVTLKVELKHSNKD